MGKAIFCMALVMAASNASFAHGIGAPAISGDFVMERSASELLDSMRSIGRFTAKNDGQIYWEVLRPARVAYVKTKTEMCQDYGQGPEPAKRARQLERLSVVFKALLSDDFSPFEDYFEITRSTQDDVWSVRMFRTPEDNPWLLKLIEAAGEGAAINKLEIIGYFDDSTTIEFSDIRSSATHEISCRPEPIEED